MPLVTLEKACLAFGHHALLDHVDFQLDAGERVGFAAQRDLQEVVVAVLPGAAAEQLGVAVIGQIGPRTAQRGRELDRARDPNHCHNPLKSNE